MGDVYRAHDRELDESIALKVVRDELMRVAGVAERFRAEVKLARRVTHRNVARTFELGRHDRLTFFTMELVDGESLTARLAQGPLAKALAIAIAVALCDALAAAHAVGVIHRDLKPDNVLLARDGRVVLTDFGVAALTSAHDESSSGTPRYMAPEQALGERATPAVDIYALGLVLLEMLTGAPAFVGGIGTVLEAKHDDRALPGLDALDPALAAIIAQATAREPSARWPSAQAMRTALAPAQPAPHAEPAPLLVPTPDDVGLPTVLLTPPRALGEVAHLAHGFHQELVRRLSRRGHLRVLRRTHGAVGGGGALVAVEAIDHASIAITLGGRAETIALNVPLAIDALVEGAELASRLIAAAVGAGPERGAEEPPLPARAREHLWRGQARLRGEDLDRQATLAEFTAAQALAPRDPRVMAGLAMCEVRAAFFASEPRAEVLAAAAAHATAAAAAAPHLAEAQIACGHVRLHQGDATGAAIHFRAAIARAPYLAEAHEWLGRMLLEAGFLVDGMARTTDALEMAPDLEAPRWDLARTFALEDRWDEHDAVIAELAERVGPLRGRFGARLRFAAWRARTDDIVALRTEIDETAGLSHFERAMLVMACDVALGMPWTRVKDAVVAQALGPNAGAGRRRAFTGQIIAEIAGSSGDADTVIAMLDDATRRGLFDRHWLARCRLLDVARARPEFAAISAAVGRRADAVLDALYGDHATRGTAETLLVGAPR
ncbi:MAG: serine/threonine protein kinase [Deltaproteobacteria bacterium]|nr:serine/threonine protein kinase [Deltaproteobacteria bacterium]